MSDKGEQDDDNRYDGKIAQRVREELYVDMDRTTNNPTPEPAGEARAPDRLLDAIEQSIRSLGNAELANQTTTGRMVLSQDGLRYVAALRERLRHTRATQPATAPGDLTTDDYEEVLADHRRLVRELDQLLNGENAAKQARLVDIVAQLRARAATPTDVAERARRAVSKLREANILLADPTDAELAEATDIIAAEFGGEN